MWLSNCCLFGFVFLKIIQLRDDIHYWVKEFGLSHPGLVPILSICSMLRLAKQQVYSKGTVFLAQLLLRLQF